jgi:hypothetical protein
LRADPRASFGAQTAALLDTDPTARFDRPASFHADAAALFNANSSTFHADAPAPLHANPAAFLDADAATLADLAPDTPAVPTGRAAPSGADAQAITAAVKAWPAPSIFVPAVLRPGPSILDVINHRLFLDRSANSLCGNRGRFGNSDRQADQHGHRQDH